MVGDPRQLPEIDAGGLFACLAQSPSTLHLSDNRRQQQPWERDALARLRAGNIDPAIAMYTAHGRIHQATDLKALRAEVVTDYLRARTDAKSPHEVAILAVSRADVAHLNALVRAALIANGELGATPLEVATSDTADLAARDDSLEMRTGDLVIVGRNDNRLALWQHRAVAGRRRPRVTFQAMPHTDDNRDVAVPAHGAPSHDLSHAYAMTLQQSTGPHPSKPRTAVRQQALTRESRSASDSPAADERTASTRPPPSCPPGQANELLPT